MKKLNISFALYRMSKLVKHSGELTIKKMYDFESLH
jgi:hypothetical protein